jgi:cytoskeletal protein RodZ
MENDEFDFLAPAYVRGFLRSYAAFLGLDPAPLLSEFDDRHEVERVPTQQLLELDDARHRRGSGAKAKSPFSSMGASSASMSKPSSINHWAVAAVVALLAIIALSLIGILNPGNPASPTSGRNNGGGSNVANAPSPSATASPTPSSSATKPSNKILAQAGLKVTLDATNGACWILVVSDGQTAGQVTLQTGQSRTFAADHKMYIKLGNAGAVQLTVNGRKLGPLGSVGQVVGLTLPDDIKSYL